jgi:hypothetical protein
MKMVTTESNAQKFSVIPIKILVSFFIETEKANLKFIWQHKRPSIAKAILSKKSNAGDNTMRDFKLYQCHRGK